MKIYAQNTSIRVEKSPTEIDFLPAKSLSITKKSTTEIIIQDIDRYNVLFDGVFSDIQDSNSSSFSTIDETIDYLNEMIEDGHVFFNSTPPLNVIDKQSVSYTLNKSIIIGKYVNNSICVVNYFTNDIIDLGDYTEFKDGFGDNFNNIDDALDYFTKILYATEDVEEVVIYESDQKNTNFSINENKKYHIDTTLGTVNITVVNTPKLTHFYIKDLNSSFSPSNQCIVTFPNGETATLQGIDDNFYFYRLTNDEMSDWYFTNNITGKGGIV